MVSLALNICKHTAIGKTISLVTIRSVKQENIFLRFVNWIADICKQQRIHKKRIKFVEITNNLSETTHV